MPVVVDASAVLAWVLQEDHPHLDLIVQSVLMEELIAPTLWWFEVRNGLLVNERRKQQKSQTAEQSLRDIADLAITLDHTPDEVALMGLARKHRLTVYDAAYLELALREHVPLATLDAALAAAAKRERVAVLGSDS